MALGQAFLKLCSGVVEIYGGAKMSDRSLLSFKIYVHNVYFINLHIHI